MTEKVKELKDMTLAELTQKLKANQEESEKIKQIIKDAANLVKGIEGTTTREPAHSEGKGIGQQINEASRAKSKGKGNGSAVSDADKQTFLAAVEKMVKASGKEGQRLNAVAKEAGLKKNAKAVKAALIADGKLNNSLAWVSLKK